MVGWLEGPTGNVYAVRPQQVNNYFLYKTNKISIIHTLQEGKQLAFAVSLGATYELVAAVYARGRMLARLPSFTFQCPQDTKKQSKKHGSHVPLAAFISQSLFQKFSSVDKDGGSA